MPSRLVRTVDRNAKRVPGLRRIPILQLFFLAELIVIAREHVAKLTPAERQRVLELVWVGRGWPHNLKPRERAELQKLVAKAEPRLFVGQAIEKLSPISLPDRFLYGGTSRRTGR